MKDFDGPRVQLYPDLSWLTPQQRRALQPLLHVLSEHSIPYRWGFLFSLSARKYGKTLILFSPEDLRAFCKDLNVPCLDSPGWELLPDFNSAAEPWQVVQHQKQRCQVNSSTSS